ncbi:MAG: tetratricopeptide repeat protein [Planctomycetota bacterium]|nr:tetratricopeptide repeat protein [Planctomycetota bacterium]
MISLRSHWSRRAAVAAFALTLVASAHAQDNKDSVSLKAGTTESGKIKSEDYAGVVIDVKGDKTIAWNDIAVDGISYANAVSYQSARDQFVGGKFDDALKAFDELKAEKNVRPVFKQHALYYSAYINQRQGKLDEALAGYKDLLTAFPKSRYLNETAENYANLFLAKKDAASGAKLLDTLSGDALTAGVDGSFSAAVNVQKGRLLEDQGKFAEAQAAFTVAEKAPGVVPSVVSLAILGQGRCAVALGDKVKAEGLFRKIVNSEGSGPILAGGWNGIGDLLLEEGKGSGANKKPDTDKITDAMYCYMRGVVQYIPLPGESSAEYERALASSAQCFEYLSQLDTRAESKAANKARAQARRDQLAREYPNSPYNSKK